MIALPVDTVLRLIQLMAATRLLLEQTGNAAAADGVAALQRALAECLHGEAARVSAEERVH